VEKYTPKQCEEIAEMMITFVGYQRAQIEGD